MTPALDLDFDSPPSNPVPLIEAWVDAAGASGQYPNPSAMTLATVDAEGAPAARVVLMRGFDETGICFFTNYDSPKSQALAANERCALVFHWDHHQRQLRIEGRASRTSDSESDAYWNTRPRESQLAACASAQSDVVGSRVELSNEFLQLKDKLGDTNVARPSNWGGFRVSLDVIEFWQGQPARLHDRLRYTRGEHGWVTSLLWP